MTPFSVSTAGGNLEFKSRRKKLRLPEEKLVFGLQNMQNETIPVLYDMYSASLYRVISSIVIMEEVAQDLLQETFIKIWKSINTYDPKKGRLYTWMARLAKNISIDYLRSAHYRNDSLSGNTEGVVELIDQNFHISYNPEIIGVREMTNILNPEHRSALDMVYFKGYTQAEAAEELNIPLSTLKSRIQAALSVLKKAYKEKEYVLRHTA